MVASFWTISSDSGFIFFIEQNYVCQQLVLRHENEDKAWEPKWEDLTAKHKRILSVGLQREGWSSMWFRGYPYVSKSCIIDIFTFLN